MPLRAILVPGPFVTCALCSLISQLRQTPQCLYHLQGLPHSQPGYILQGESARRAITGAEFFNRYPSLHSFLLTQLTAATQQLEQGATVVHPSLTPVLALLSRLRLAFSLQFLSPSLPCRNPSPCPFLPLLLPFPHLVPHCPCPFAPFTSVPCDKHKMQVCLLTFNVTWVQNGFRICVQADFCTIGQSGLMLH